MPVENRVMDQESLMQVLKPRARFYPELVVQRAPDLAIGREGFGLPAETVQRRHPLLVQVLLQGILRDQAVDLGKGVCVPAQSQVRLDPQPLRQRPHRVQPRDNRPCEAEIRHVGEHLAPPQTQAPRQLSGRLFVGMTLEGVTTRVDRELENRGIDLRAGDVQAVAARLGDQDLPGGAVCPIRLEHLAKVEDVRLHRRHEPVRSLLPPQSIPQPPDRHDGAGRRQQQGQDAALLMAAESEPLT
jgi:hypothetical protein